MTTIRDMRKLKTSMTSKLLAVHPTSAACALLLLLDVGLIWFVAGGGGTAMPVADERYFLMGTVGLGQYVFFALVVTAAFAARGATGFGSAAIAVPLATLALPVQFVIPVVASLQLVSTTEYSVRNWRAVDWREMLRIAPFLVAGVLLGLYLFYRLDAHVIARGLGIIVIVYAIYAMVTAGREQGGARRLLSWPTAILLNTVGALVGALFGGASSPFYVIYFKALSLSRDAFRATMSMVVLVQVVLRVGGYAAMGLFDATILLAALFTLPFMLVGGRLGDIITERVSAITFNRFVGVVLLISGMALTVK